MKRETTMKKYDISYSPKGPEIQPHFCREEDCFGGNPDHGLSWSEAVREMVTWHAKKIQTWMEAKEEDLN